MRSFAIMAVAALAGLAECQTAPAGKVKRSVSELNESYDFIIVGGGTAGLTVADRLTARFPKKTVLVVEIGDHLYAPAVFEPPGSPPTLPAWGFETQPIKDLNGRKYVVQVGKALGGGTTINGQFLDRGGAQDYDAWQALAGGEFDDYVDKWDFNGLLPYFQKSVTFHPPTVEQVEEYGFTYDVASAYGGTTPVDAYYAPFQWPMQKVSFAAWAETNSSRNGECYGGRKIGTCWIPQTQNPVTAERSTAAVGHFEAVIDRRPNYHVLVLHQALRVVFPKGADGKPDLTKAPAVEIASVSGAGKTSVIRSKREVVLSAGALNTPQILQRSGIGAKAVLDAAGIPQLRELPGVGQNFADHPYIFYGAQPATVLQPNADMLTKNATFLAEALAAYAERPARGPYTQGQGNSGAFVPLQAFAPNYKEIVAGIKQQVADGSYVNYLPAGTDKTVLEGYKAQLLINAEMLLDPEVAAWESPSAALAALGVLLRPLSRGSVNINPANLTGAPIIDIGTLSNPADLEQLVHFVPFFRRFYQAKAITETLGPVTETVPGAGVTTRDQLVSHIRSSLTPGFAHPCCTASMLPLSRGGVVAPDLKVHGIRRLSIADLSVLPILPGAHTMSTAYAIGEKAADIIIRRYSACSQ